MPGLFVTLDGPGGAGKSTIARLVAERLVTAGFAVHSTTEPSQGQLGRIARDYTHIYRGLSLACLVAADRYHHLEIEIRPALAAGHVVVCDRYIASTFVLQRLDGVDTDFLRALNAHADRPDLAIILTADPGTLTKRLRSRGSHGRFEDNLDSPRAEVALYQEAAVFLAADGVTVATLDTSSDTPEDHAINLGRKITALSSPM